MMRDCCRNCAGGPIGSLIGVQAIRVSLLWYLSAFPSALRVLAGEVLVGCEGLVLFVVWNVDWDNLDWVLVELYSYRTRGMAKEC
jgi:hypothetical protein